MTGKIPDRPRVPHHVGNGVWSFTCRITNQDIAMRTREAMTISLPSEMLKEVERVRKLEHRTRSELMREALRAYFSGRRFQEVLASPEEIRAIRRGRAEIREGKYVTLDQLLDEMDIRRRTTTYRRQ